MRGLAIFGALVAALMVLTPAPVQAYRSGLPAVASPLVQVGAEYRRDRDRRYERGRRYERRWRGGSRWRWRTSCHNQWRDGRRERVCRRIRYRR